MSNWPATLPQQFFLGASVTDRESRLVSSMDAGPASVRKRFTATPQDLTTTMVLTGTQKAAFDTFYRTTINYGTDSFTWTDPTDDTSATLRFLKPPVWTCICGGSAANRLWQAQLELEILP